MSDAVIVSFEQAFPDAFAGAVRGLVDGDGLDELLQELCTATSRRLAPRAVGVVRLGEDRPAPLDPEVAVAVRRDVAGPDGRPWGSVELSALPPSVVGGSDPDVDALDALSDFVAWLVERHAERRRHIASIDRERQLIAGQIHDDSIQVMTAISLHLQRLARSTATDREQIERLLRLTNGAIDRLRHLMFALHPPSLARDGLTATLQDYLDAFIAPTGLDTVVHADADRRSSQATEALAFRLARGAIHNAWKHAGAGRVDVVVEVSDRGVAVVVSDDGVGFDARSVIATSVGHAGLAYSRDLAAEVGGTFDVVSAPGRGTKVTIELPVL